MTDAYQLLMAALIFGALAGCAKTPPLTKTVVTPPLIPYSNSVQLEAAGEMKVMMPPCPRDAVFGGCSAVKRMVLDYKWIRKKIKAGKK